MPSKRVRPKVRGKKDVIDEWEFIDIDRDQQKAGLKRRAKRWKEIDRQIANNKKAEKIAIKNAEKMNPDLRRQPNAIESAWLRCDYVIYNIMQQPAYNQMEEFRTNDPKAYKALYKVFMSKYMMEHIQYFVDYFASGQVVKKKITLADIIKNYRKIRGIKAKIIIKRKGKKDIEL